MLCRDRYDSDFLRKIYYYIQIMADYSIGEKILEARLYEKETSRPPEPDHVINLKHGVVREAYELFLTHFGTSPINVSFVLSNLFSSIVCQLILLPFTFFPTSFAGAKSCGGTRTGKSHWRSYRLL